MIPLQTTSGGIIDFGLGFLEGEVDGVLFQTNEFLTNETFYQANGPFWWILQICVAVAFIACITVIASMAYKMMVKKEGIDVLKLMRPLAISIVLSWWYPPSGGTNMVEGDSHTDWCVLDFLAMVPNAIGSYTHDLYELEAMQLENTYQITNQLMSTRDSMVVRAVAVAMAGHESMTNPEQQTALAELLTANAVSETSSEVLSEWVRQTAGGLMVMLDKIIMFIALVVYRIGWWSTIYAQQIMLGVLTIFGPLQWAFSIFNKWEGAWAKWITRYLSVHFIGAMLYFVGFYVLLLFDICLHIQNSTLEVTADAANVVPYLRNAFLTTGYLMAASVVSVKCLAMVPELAAWIIPEGESGFAARSFAEGAAGGMQTKIKAAMPVGGGFI